MLFQTFYFINTVGKASAATKDLQGKLDDQDGEQTDDEEDDEFGSASLLDDDLASLSKKKVARGEQGVVALSGITVNPHSLLQMENHPTVKPTLAVLSNVVSHFQTDKDLLRFIRAQKSQLFIDKIQ